MMFGRKTITIESIIQFGECLDTPYLTSPWTGNPTQKLVFESYDALIAHFKSTGEVIGDRGISFLDDGIMTTKVSESYFIGRCFVDNRLFPTRHPASGSYNHLIDVVGSEDDVRNIISEIRRIAAEKAHELKYRTLRKETYKIKKEVDLHELVAGLKLDKYDGRMEFVRTELKRIGRVVK